MLLLRYGVVGTANTAASYGIYALLIYAGAALPLASLGALSAGVVISFVTLGRIVFASQLKGRFPRFLGVWSALYLAHIGLTKLLLLADMSAYLAGFLASGPVIVLSFLLQRHWIFR